MDIRTLRYFLAVAREESISGAAQSLHMTQPPLSRAMSDLETEIGKQLLIRGNRRITLTEEGLLLRKRAAEIIELMEKTEKELSADEKDLICGDIHIGGGETDAMRMIARVAADLKREYPGIKYHLFSGNADDVAERLDKGLLDFGIMIEPADIRKYDYMNLPAKDTWGLLMRRDSPLASLDAIRPENLLGIPLLTSRQNLVSNVLSGWTKKDLDQLNVVVTYNLIYNAALMVEEGLGYALTLDKLVNTSGNSALVFLPLSPALESGLNIVWKKYQFFSKAAEKFLQRLQDTLIDIS